MGTTTSALTSGTSALPSGTSTFSGTSTYAGDLQQAINRAVAVASIPLTQLQNNVQDLQNDSGELTYIQGLFTSIQTSIQNLSSASNGNSLAATTSDNTVATASVNSSQSPTAGTYTLNIISAGSPTTTLSDDGLPTVADPSSTSISTSSSFTLSVDGSTFTINPASNTLNALAQSINTANAGVTATILNIGSPTAPDYRLSLQSTALGSASIQLNDGTQPLLNVLTTGAPATYQVDGQPSTPISSNSSTVTIAPGITVDLLQAGQTTVTVAPDSSSASSALSAFATAYNAAVTELNANHGNVGGPLTGQSITMQLQQSLQDLVQYSGGSGGAQNLTDLGLTFNQQGQLTFDQATFQSVEASDPNDVANFLGSATTGGFLQSATNVLNGLEDPNTGLFQATNTSFPRIRICQPTIRKRHRYANPNHQHAEHLDGADVPG